MSNKARVPDWLSKLDETSFGYEHVTIPRARVREFIELFKAAYPQNNRLREIFLWPAAKDKSLTPTQFREVVSIPWDQVWRKIEEAGMGVDYEIENKIMEVVEDIVAGK